MTEVVIPKTARIRAEFNMQFEFASGGCKTALTLALTDPPGMALPKELFCPTLKCIQQACQNLIDRHETPTQGEPQ